MYLKTLTVLGLAVYAIASHLALTYHQLQWAFALALAPMVLSMVSYIARLWLAPNAALHSKPALIVACIISVVSLVNYWASLSQFTEWLFLTQNVGANAALGLMFGLTLRPGRTPLITQFAQILHSDCDANMIRYTRTVTWVWVGFFAAMCLISLGLFFFAPLQAWSVFINLLAWPLVAALFVLEFGWRKYAHPEFEAISIQQGIQAFMNHYKQDPAAQLPAQALHSSLIAHTHASQSFAFFKGQIVCAGRFVQDVNDLKRQLPTAGAVLNLCGDRYRFSVTLAAALLRQQVCLLPSSLTPNMVADLLELHPDLYCVIDEDSQISVALPVFQCAIAHEILPIDQAAGGSAPYEVPQILNAQIAAIVFTSGSTGKPIGHTKTWGKLCINARAEGKRLKIKPGHCMVATVPAQHMYGFESSVLMPWQMGATLHAGKPFYPSDVMQALDQVTQPRCLISTPFHLRTLIDSALPWPVTEHIVSATAPLTKEMAQQIESVSHAALAEIYGCTESGQLASRLTAHTDQWQTLEGALVYQVDGHSFAKGSYIEGEILLSDVLQLQDATHFTLLGRSADMVNIAGKRSSLSYLSQQLIGIDGVQDGVITAPALDVTQDIQRLIAVVVAPNLTKQRLLEQLRTKIDSVFLPRQIYFVSSLPRNATGKLTSDQLSRLLDDLSKKID